MTSKTSKTQIIVCRPLMKPKPIIIDIFTGKELGSSFKPEPIKEEEKSQSRQRRGDTKGRGKGERQRESSSEDSTCSSRSGFFKRGPLYVKVYFPKEANTSRGSIQSVSTHDGTESRVPEVKVPSGWTKPLKKPVIEVASEQRAETLVISTCKKATEEPKIESTIPGLKFDPKVKFETEKEKQKRLGYEARKKRREMREANRKKFDDSNSSCYSYDQNSY